MLNARLKNSIISKFIDSNSKVLDIGCGNGETLIYLKSKKNIDARGIEISAKNVELSISKGLSVIQGDATTDLNHYPSNSFDYVILSNTLQAVKNPIDVLEKLTNIGKKVIVVFPNFGYWKVIMSLILKSKMPVTKDLPYLWYNTPNIHLCTIMDFVSLCHEFNLIVNDHCLLNEKKESKLYAINKFSSFFCSHGFFVISKKIV